MKSSQFCFLYFVLYSSKTFDRYESVLRCCIRISQSIENGTQTYGATPKKGHLKSFHETCLPRKDSRNNQRCPIAKSFSELDFVEKVNAIGRRQILIGWKMMHVCEKLENCFCFVDECVNYMTMKLSRFLTGMYSSPQSLKGMKKYTACFSGILLEQLF
jgi:hypothetical protein